MAKKPTVQSPIPTVQVINDPRPALPRAEQPCLWTKARENRTRFIRAKGRVKKSLRACRKSPHEKMWRVLVTHVIL